MNSHAGIDLVVGRKGNGLFDGAVVLCMLLTLTTFLAVQGGTSAGFYGLCLLAFGHFAVQPGALRATASMKGAATILIALSAVFVATLIGKLVRGEPRMNELDSPSRFMFAGLVFLMFLHKRISLVRVFEVAAPLSLLLALAMASVNPEVHSRWSGRFATNFVDPNTLGSYATILLFMNLVLLNASAGRRSRLAVLQAGGVAAGIVLSMLAASRGGWLAIIPLFAVWVFMGPKGRRRGLLAVAAMVALLLAAGLFFLPSASTRAVSAFSEVVGWFDGSQTETAAGQRLSVWKLSLALIATHPFFGSGWAVLREQLAQQSVPDPAAPSASYILSFGGTHNDLLTMVLRSGFPGLVAFVLLIFGPMLFFWRRRVHVEGDARLACTLGVSLTVGVLVCGLSNEMLSLKYLSSYYALMVAGLAAEALRDDMPATAA